MEATAIDTTERPDPARASWARFDAGWYLRTYPQARGALTDLSDGAVQAYYGEHGQRQGHSPNPFFDEAFFLRATGAAAQAVRDGRAASGFDLYRRDSGRHRLPHWLFDEAGYRARYADLSDETLAVNGLVNGYDHFLRHGAREGRIGSLFFDPAAYAAKLSPEEEEQARGVGWFLAYITRLHDGVGAELATSLYFDPAWYLRKYRSAAALVAKRTSLSALHHYLTNDAPTQFDPLPEFSEQFYLKQYPDVAAAVRAGSYRNGYDHFLSHGVFERRAPCEAIDLKYYVDANAAVRRDLRRGLARDAFAHYLGIGRAQGLRAAPPPDETFTEGQARTLFRLRAQTLLPLFARRPLDFSYTGTPALSVVMVLHDGFALTMQTLGSLRTNFAGAIELILVDSGSTDETLRIERCVRGATVLRFDMDIGAVRGGNAGLQCVSADAVLLLGSDIEFAPGAVAAALDRLQADATIGAVGGKTVRAHGRLDDAGGIVWRDGALGFYLRGAAPAAPEANFVRDVDFCPGGFLLARSATLQDLEGFAPDAAPGSYEYADLCLRIGAAGLRVVYDPAVVLHRLESGAPASLPPSETEMAQARDAFVERHADALRTRLVASSRSEVFARRADAPWRRVLFIADALPLRMTGGGAVRSNDMIAAMAAGGCHVTVFPLQPHRFDLAAIYGDFPDTVEVMHDRAIDDLTEFLGRRAGYYDVVWVAGAAGLARVRSAIGAIEQAPRIVLDTQSIAALARPPDEDGAEAGDLAGAFEAARDCRHVVAVSEAEAGRLRGFGLDPVSTIGPTARPSPTPRHFQDRLGMLFVGALAATGDPNHDGLCWFVDAVLPRVEQSLGWETRLTIAGHADDPALLDRFRDHPRITLRGALVDLTPLYDQHRLFVAPTRFAAGLPYKVYEAARFGLPVVASEILCRQMGWQDGHDMLSATADPARFAAQIIDLYRDPALWQRLRDAALARLAVENSPERFIASVQAMLE